MILHHTPDTNVSCVDTTAVCATIAHHGNPRNETPTTALYPEQDKSLTHDKTMSLPSLPLFDTSAADATTAPNPVTSCHLNELAAMLGTQMRYIEEAKTEAKKTVADIAIITELETLMTAARDAVEKAVRSLVAELLTDVSLPRPNTTDTEQTTNMQTGHSPWSRPIGNTAVRTVFNLSHLMDPVNTPNIPKTYRESRQLNEATNSVGAIRIEQSRSKGWNQTYERKEFMPTAENSAIDTENRVPLAMIMNTIGTIPDQQVNQNREDHNWRRRSSHEH